MSNKEMLRKRQLERRNRLAPEYMQESSEEICRNLIEHPVFQQSTTICFYMPFRNEVDVRKAMETAIQLGKQVVLPRVDRASRQLRGYRVDSLCDCEVGAYGILEPPAIKERFVAGEELEAVIVPGVAFDLQGYRLGYGGGYYDRLFAQPLKAWRIGVAYPEQIVPTVYPEAHDQPLHLLVSSQQVVSFVK
ncbi:5-formyltetrahydrofolate cyclo-ligase [Laceyella putida]|uniref:5-formyltetrahydrofolate cyclo-ligase n=1 Tax=Laceyella putida TaxID=110101 RepID=A0ABW2RLJ7_9BACL